MTDPDTRIADDIDRTLAALDRGELPPGEPLTTTQVTDRITARHQHPYNETHTAATVGDVSRRRIPLTPAQELCIRVLMEVTDAARGELARREADLEDLVRRLHEDESASLASIAELLGKSKQWAHQMVLRSRSRQ